MSRQRLRLRIASEADVSRSLLETTRMARALGFAAVDTQALSTAVSELVRNILKYAESGEVELEEVDGGRRSGLQVTVRDRGPGIPDIEAAMSDHFSSGGTLGLGLPGVRRMMDDFEIESTPGKGTRVVIRKWREAERAAARVLTQHAARRGPEQQAGGSTEGARRAKESLPDAVECGSFVRPCRGERVSGDAGVVSHRGGLSLVAIVDALGHGPQAHAVATRAVRHLKEAWTPDVAATLQALHGALKGTGGAAAALCVVDGATGVARCAGVGNAAMRVFGTQESRAYSSAGTLGHQMRTPREQRLALDPGDVLVLYTDGVKGSFDAAEYPELRSQSPGTIARTLVQRFGKDHDDAGCVVLKRDR
jgi:anti-sigma regulatory factor (Ser/Thr protein kinase)